ncbi:MAG: acyl-CoA dehydratase activase [Nitrospiraceae bacterium]|nr:acyl-CoA dehydratase activase [Nitrospiraceae bacterium]
MNFIGLDAGSVSVKLVSLDNGGNRLHSVYQRHKGQPLTVALQLLKEVLGVKSEESGVTPHFSLSLTGSAGRLIGSVLGLEPVNEVVAYAYATRRLYPRIRTIIELGGEDSKLIMLGEGSGAAKDFSMNSVCAAGTGSFLDQQAERLRLSIEEFSELCLKSKNPPRIAGRCSVFAKSDMIHLQQIASPMEDIVAGLCFAVARNFKGSIARGREIKSPVSFQGGVAANAGMVRAFREIFCLDELFVPEEHALMGAFGAAMKNLDSGAKQTFDLKKLEDFISSARPAEKGHRPLIGEGDRFSERHLKDSEEIGVRSKESPPPRLSPHTSRVKAYLGIDIGSISTNLAVIDEDCRLLAKRYLMTAGRPIEAVKQGLEEIGREIGDIVEIVGVGTTGSGRYMIADYVGADIVKNEITAQATAAAFIDKEVDTIFEIGGQDSKYISLRDGVIADFEMNKACAAGTGSFLEEQAEKLSIPIKLEFQKLALKSGNPCRLGERCTVFMENSLMSNLQRGAGREDLLAGLAYSIVQNYINRVVGKRPIGRKIFFQGGVAFNKSVVAAFEKYLGMEITVPPNHDVTGAIGMALIAKKQREDKKEVRSKESGVRAKHPLTSFKGFELSKRPYEISSFECKGCPNVCEINRVKVEGEKGYLFYGGRCEKYDVKKNRQENNLPDLFALREDLLWKAHLNYSEQFKVKSEKAEDEDHAPHTSRLAPQTVRSSRPKIGIPYVFYFHDFLPFWSTLLWELGFEVEVSGKTNRKIVDLGLESVLSETCFPVKTAHGHIKHLIDNGVDTIFMPSFVNLNLPDDTFERGFACPYTQTIPYSARVAFENGKFLTPVIDLSRGDEFIKKELKKVFGAFGVKASEISRAYDIARGAQEAFLTEIRDEGKRLLSALKERTVVIVGRAYNSFDKGMNLNIPRKLADLGVMAVPMDFLPMEPSSIDRDWPNMYWRAGQRILSAARLARANPLLYAVYIGNFSCGPDSFIIKFFEEEMSGKPYLHLEIDAHSADAGAITRCEAFLDSVGNHGVRRPEPEKSAKSGVRSKELRNENTSRLASYSKRTVYIPHMSDHAFALAAAFEYCGADAEVLPQSTKEAVDLGKKFVSGKECYPCAVTTGDMVRKIQERGFVPSKSAFFMPSGSGPCRFGQYNVFHRLVIRELGYEDIPVLSPNQDENFYEHLGVIGGNFAMRSWQGIIAIELLTKCLHETRPYEVEKGSSDALYEEYLRKACKSIKGADGNIESLLRKARADFEHLSTIKDPKPLIGIVGEIFVRSNKFSNEDLVRKVEALGGEAYLSPVEEWICYINHMAFRKVLIKKDWSGMIKLLLKTFFQKRIEHGFGKNFEGFLRNLHEPDSKELLAKAGPYLHSSFEGEAILSIGKSIDLITRGASGIINAMPFGCMPGTIVSGLMRGVGTDFGIPCLSLPYDGTESLTTEIQLEAFIDQAKEFKRR